MIYIYITDDIYLYMYIYIYNYIYMTSGFEVSKAFWQKIVSPCVTAGYYTWCSTMGFAWIPWYTTLIVIIGVKPICAIPQSPSTTADSRHCSRVCSESCSGCRLLVILVCLSWCRGWDLMAGKSFPVSRDFRFRSIRHLGNIESAWINDHLFWMHKTRNAAIQSHSRSWLIALPISFWAACRASIGLALVTTRMSHGIAPMIKSRSQEEQEKNTSNTKDLYGILWPWNPAIHPTSPLRLSIQATHTWLQLQQPSWCMIMLYHAIRFHTMLYHAPAGDNALAREHRKLFLLLPLGVLRPSGSSNCLPNFISERFRSSLAGDRAGKSCPGIMKWYEVANIQEPLQPVNVDGIGWWVASSHRPMKNDLACVAKAKHRLTD